MDAARSDAIGGIAGKLTVASGAGGAAYATVSGETLIAIASLSFTAAAFFVNWFYEQKKAKREEVRLENERLLAQQRLEMEAFDRAEQRRIMEAAWAKAEKRRAKRDAAAITQMQQLGSLPAFRDTGMPQLGGGA
jgi:hypothetical protein